MKRKSLPINPQHSSGESVDGLHSGRRNHHCQSYLQRPSGSNKAKITLHAEGTKTERQGQWIENLFGGVVRLRVVFLLGEDDVEDGVRAATRLIHVGRSHSPTKIPPNAIISFIFDTFKYLLSCVHSHTTPLPLSWTTWPYFQSPSGPGCHYRKWRLAWTDLQHKVPSEGAPWPAGSLCSWDSAGHARARSRSPCNSPFKGTCTMCSWVILTSGDSNWVN